VSKKKSDTDVNRVPEAYRPSEAEESAGPEGRARKTHNEQGGSKRNLHYPEAPEALPIAVVDNHTHLDFLDGTVNVSARDALAAAEAVGVKGLIQVGCDVPSSEYAVQVANEYASILAAVAIHPNDAARLAEAGELESSLERIEELASDPRVRALGETGLDYFRTGEDGRGAQQHSFREHLRIAAQLGKAVQIHDRDAHDDVVRILQSSQLPPKVVFHCFSGDERLAKICNDNGWYMSFSGTVTFKNSHELRAALNLADPQLLLVETDAPFLTPHPFRGRPNASYMIPYTTRFMAETKGVELAEFCARIDANTREVYGEF